MLNPALNTPPTILTTLITESASEVLELKRRDRRLSGQASSENLEQRNPSLPSRVVGLGSLLHTRAVFKTARSWSDRKDPFFLEAQPVRFACQAAPLTSATNGPSSRDWWTIGASQKSIILLEEEKHGSF